MPTDPSSHFIHCCRPCRSLISTEETLRWFDGPNKPPLLPLVPATANARICCRQSVIATNDMSIRHNMCTKCVWSLTWRSTDHHKNVLTAWCWQVSSYHVPGHIPNTTLPEDPPPPARAASRMHVCLYLVYAVACQPCHWPKQAQTAECDADPLQQQLAQLATIFTLASSTTCCQPPACHHQLTLPCLLRSRL